MNIIKRTYLNVKESVVRFPVSLIFGIAASVLFSVLVWKDNIPDEFENAIYSYIKPVCWTIVFSIFMQLLAERIMEIHPAKNAKLLYLVLQCACVVLCFFPIRFIFMSNGIFTIIAYLGTMFALILGIFYLLKYVHGEGLLEYSITYSFGVSAVACWCICAGFSLIVFAVQKLILRQEGNDNIYITIFIVSIFVFAIQFFVAYISKKDEFVIPKATYVIYFFILLPLYSILIAVLYVYLVQSLVLKNMPHMNWFVSIATALFIAFWFSFRPFDNKSTRLFYKLGAYVLSPLVIVQWINFIERINSYGFTTVRVASLYYIIFSTVFLILSMIKCGKYNFHAIWILAVVILIASITPLNIKRIAVLSQKSKIENIYKSHNLFKDGKIMPISEIDQLSGAEKKQITESFDSFGSLDLESKDDESLFRLIGFWDDNPKFLSTHELFKDTFGFEKYYSYNNDENSKTWDFDADDTVLDISSYSQMAQIIDVAKEDQRPIIKSKLGNYDITDFINEKIANSDSYDDEWESNPIYNASEDTVIYFTYIYYHEKETSEEKSPEYFLNARGFVLKK